MKDSRRIFLGVSFPKAGFKRPDLAVSPAAKLSPPILGLVKREGGGLLKFKGAPATTTPKKGGRMFRNMDWHPAGCLWGP